MKRGKLRVVPNGARNVPEPAPERGPSEGPETRISLTLGYPPSTNRYWRVWRGRAVKSAEATAYIRNVKWRALAQGLSKPLSGPVVMALTVYRPRRVGDLSNRIKVLEDALQGIAFEDDSQVCEIHALRLEDPTNPRVEVRVEAVAP